MASYTIKCSNGLGAKIKTAYYPSGLWDSHIAQKVTYGQNLYKIIKKTSKTENNVIGKNVDPYCMCYTTSMSGLLILSYYFGLQEALYMVHCRTKSK